MMYGSCAAAGEEYAQINKMTPCVCHRHPKTYPFLLSFVVHAALRGSVIIVVNGQAPLLGASLTAVLSI